MNEGAIDKKSLPEDTVLRITRRVRAPQEKVFRAFTDATLLRQWWGPKSFTLVKAEVDLRPGGAFHFEMRSDAGTLRRLSGTYREVRPFDRLVHTWIWGEGDLAGVETLVTMEFHDLGGVTELRLTHVLPTTTARDQHGWGWNGLFERLDQLFTEK